ncbi:hypothetical protein MmTuc01_1159 [Methanosarcina mazei Tuc01]|uniref:Uncharacterized protein n=1 Tax=Methanosarcina mazei Tuc01 TaxID=1236903 RepID=M1Q8N7_METMZ|nr:hypothetical protein MmTuc01_1159 [Methanosarcina mazei Tuc01]
MWGGHVAHRVSLSNHIIGISHWRWSGTEVLAFHFFKSLDFRISS